MNFKVAHPSGKTVYWVNGKSFENSKDKRDGREKAEKYCLENFINTNNIRKFDSRTERDRWEYLLDLQNKGVISNLDHHFTLKIQDEFVNANNDTIPPITYEADFIYKELETGRRIVEDVKGSEYFIDERFITIKQVFDYMMMNKSLYIRVMLKRDNTWVEWHIGDKKKSQKLIKKQREEIKTLREEKHQSEMLRKKEERERIKVLREEKHKQEIAENKKAREIERLKVLRAKTKLTKQERLRLAELEERYSI